MGPNDSNLYVQLLFVDFGAKIIHVIHIVVTLWCRPICIVYFSFL